MTAHYNTQFCPLVYLCCMACIGMHWVFDVICITPFGTLPLLLFVTAIRYIYVYVQYTSNNTNLTSISCGWLWLGAWDGPCCLSAGCSSEIFIWSDFHSGFSRGIKCKQPWHRVAILSSTVTAAATIINRQATIKSGVGDLRPAMASPRHSQSILASGL